MTQKASDYQQAIDWIYGLINFERRVGRSRDFRVDRTLRLLDAVGNPHESIPAVHIAGTKGKGSTASMIAPVLIRAGHTTGLFTSPHITRFEERLQVDGTQPSEPELVDLVRRLQTVVSQDDRLRPTYFEAAMLLAWMWFHDRGVRLAVLEVGLGGRLDSTNVCRPEVCVITSISLDHTSVLGSTTDRIAAEKAGIIKPGIPVVSGVTSEPARGVIRDVVRERGCELWELGRDIHHTYTPPVANAFTGTVAVRSSIGEWSGIGVPLPGEHQAHNAALALTVFDILRGRGWAIPSEAVVKGLDDASSLPARIEVLSRKPLTIVDAAHNEASVGAVASALDELPQVRPRVCVFAATRQKDVEGMLRHVTQAFDHVLLTEYLKNPRSVPRLKLLEIAGGLSGGATLEVAETPALALSRARSLAGDSGMVCTTGSFFIAAEVRELILAELPHD